MTSLLEDLDLIGHLDHDPVCKPDMADCDQTAAWWIQITHQCCPTVNDLLLCHAHKREVDALFRLPGDLICLECGARPAPISTLTRPLKGGDR